MDYFAQLEAARYADIGDTLRIDNAIEDPELRAKRQERRTKLHRGSYVRAGQWDKDLDNYPELEYTIDIGNGYKCKLIRTDELGWNIYIIVPEGHFISKDGYDMTEYDFSATYHNGHMVGYDRDHLYDITPIRKRPVEEGYYTTYEMAVEEAKTYKAKLHMMCSTCGEKAWRMCSRCESHAYCNQECQRSHWREHKVVCSNELN